MIQEQPIRLVFDEPSHTYTNGDTGALFTSVTTVIGQYKDAFNKRYWSMYTGLKDKGFSVRQHKCEQYITVNKIKQHLNTLYANRLYSVLATRTQEMWQNKTDKANARGNKIHNYLEDSINESVVKELKGMLSSLGVKLNNELITPLPVEGGKSSEAVIIRTQHDLDKTTLEKTYPIIYKKLLTYIKNGWHIIAEKKLYTSHYMIAGMIDVLIVKGKKFRILDWKSNKDEMKFVSGYYKKVKDANGDWVRGIDWVDRDDRMKVPLNNLQVCKGIIYSLQLSLYAYIMEMWGYTLDNTNNEGLEICHIRPNRKPYMIKVKYYKQDIFNMLEYHLGKGFKNVNDKKVNMGFGII